MEGKFIYNQIYSANYSTVVGRVTTYLELVLGIMGGGKIRVRGGYRG